MIEGNFIIILLLIILIFSVLLLFNNKPNDNFEQVENLKKNLELVEKFEKKEIQFNKLKKANNLYHKYQTFYPVETYPQLSTIDYNVVKNELEKVLGENNDWIKWPEYDLWKTNTSSWEIIPLMAFGKWSPKYISKFPQTVSLLKNITGLVSAGFSKLGPNTRLKLHKGWGDLSNNVLRCHLGIQVPKNKCKVYVIGVNNDMMYHKNNKWIIFDDSLYHSASNEDNSRDRIILLLDIIRPKYIFKGESDIKNSQELNNFLEEFNKN